MNNSIEEKNRNCEATHEEINILFRKIHKNKFEKRIININRNLWNLFIASALPIIINVIDSINVIQIPQYCVFFLYILSCINIAYALVKINNRGFHNLDTYNKQFYILYLLRNRLEVCLNECKVGDKPKKIIKELNQIGMHFNWLIHDSLKFYRKVNLFNISVEEQYLRNFYINLNKRVLPNLEKGLYLPEISIVIKNLLKITYNLIPNYENINKITNPQKYCIDLFAECINDLNTIPIVEDEEKTTIVLKIKKFFILDNILNINIVFFVLLLLLYFIILFISHNNAIANSIIVIAIAAFGTLIKKQI